VQRFFGPWGVFFKGFLKHPVMVGSIIPSSRWTVQKMLAPVKWDECKLFVEYGPGVGTFCQPVLDKMRKDATLLVIDTNPDFIEFLRKHFRDSRFIAVHGSAADVNEIIREFGFEHADYVLSGLPFRHFPAIWGQNCRGNRQGHPPRRRLSGLSVPRPRARFHGTAFQTDRQWL
jgi:phosphatidylethanolamine/phosphatidyl-N-methylethanolamine N-methyltransferase